MLLFQLFLFLSDNSYYAADMTIFYQIPQYVLLALSEVFTIVAGKESSILYFIFFIFITVSDKELCCRFILLLYN